MITRSPPLIHELWQARLKGFLYLQYLLFNQHWNEPYIEKEKTSHLYQSTLLSWRHNTKKLVYLQIFAWSNYQIIRHLVICDYIKLKVISKSERFAPGTLSLSHWKYCFCTVGKVWNGMCYKKECYYSKNAFSLEYNSDYEVKLISLSIGLHIFSNACEGNYISFLR